MENRGFWSLFTETGEPICWLLSRVQERLPRQEEKNAPEEYRANAPETRTKL